MPAPLSMPEFFRSLMSLGREQGRRSTLLGIGPMSRRIVRVALETARDLRFPLMFIASRNQVDLEELGGGYVCSWDQAAFVVAIKEIAEQVRFDGLCYLCRDHGGLWQRDEERRARLPVERAMEIVKRSYLEDLVQGFDLLHIDPTKDPHADYLDELSLLRHPLLGISAANVAPEFGVEETASYLELAELEGSEHGRGAGSTRGSPSGFLDVFSEKAVRSERWRKWMTGKDNALTGNGLI